MSDVHEGPSSSSNSVSLHRVRFVDWTPSSITALAFLPTSGSKSLRSVLAVGHDNGNIDLCTWIQDDSVTGEISSAKGWVTDTTLVGSSSSKIDQLAFVLSPTLPHPTPRLFSTAGGSIITEHFLPPHLLEGERHSSYLSYSIAQDTSQNNSFNRSNRSISSQGGSVWSLAASPLGKRLAIGCDDGHVRIIDIEEGRFELLSPTRSARRGGDGVIRGIVPVLDRAKTRIVSLAWGPPSRKIEQKAVTSDSDESDDDDDDEWEDTFIVGGTTHSAALCWSLATGRVENKLLVDRGRKEQTIIWSVATLSNGTCIVGDSLGHVSFFDGKTRTLLPGGKFSTHGKRADVLSLCVGPDGKSVYSGSVDQKVCEFTLVGARDGTTDDATVEKWICTGRRRLHAHDIRALAIDPPYQLKPQKATRSLLLPILVSGGNDFNLVMTPARSSSHLSDVQLPRKKINSNASYLDKLSLAPGNETNPISSTPITTFADTVQRRISFVPGSGKGSLLGGGGVIRACASKRWIVLRREKSIAIWKLPVAKPSYPDEATSRMRVEDWSQVIEMQMKVQSNIVCVEISPDGRFLFVSDLYEGKLFELLPGNSDDEVIPRRLRSLTSAFTQKGLGSCPAASAAEFTPDSSRLVLGTYPGSFLHIVELPVHVPQCVLLKSFDQHRNRTTGGRAVVGRTSSVNDSNGKKKSNGTLLEEGSDDYDSSEDEQHSSKQFAKRTAFARIDNIAVSPDGQYLVSIDSLRRIHSFSLDTLHYMAALPSPSHRPSSVTFAPWHPSCVLFILPFNQIVAYDFEERNTKRLAGTNGNRSQSSLKGLTDIDGMLQSIRDRLLSVRESAIGCTWLSPQSLLVWGSTWICTARQQSKEETGKDFSVANFPKRSRSGSLAENENTLINSSNSIATKSKSSWRTQITFKYQPLLHVGTILSGIERAELLVVERPYYDVSTALPPTWFSGAPYGS